MLFNLQNPKKIIFNAIFVYFFNYYFFNWKFSFNFHFYVKILNLFYLKKSLQLGRTKRPLTGNLHLKLKKFIKMSFLKKKSQKNRLRYLTLNFSFFTKYNHYLNRASKLFSNAYPLLGQLIFTFNWTFENKKIWFRSFMLENFIKKFKHRDLKKNILSKNIYFNEYNYFSQIKMKFNDFKNFIKITNTNLKLKNENSYAFSKPYSIFNNNSFNLSKNNPYLLVIHDLYKQYLKLENFFFKNNRIFKNKNFEDLFIFFSFYKKFSSNRSLIKNWWNLKKKKTTNFDTFFKPLNNSMLKKKYKNAYKLLKKQSFLANKFFKNFKFRVYDRQANLNNIFKMKKWTKKYQKNLLYFLFFFSNNKNSFLRIKNTSVRTTSFWKTTYVNQFIINKSPVKFFSSQFDNSCLKFKIKFKRPQNHYKFSLIRSFGKNKYFKIRKFPFYSSKYNLPFISSAAGFLSLTQGFLNYFDIDVYTYNLKKKYYSFPLKNELQKFVLKRYLKTNSSVHSKYFNKIKQDQDFSKTEISFLNIKKKLLTDPRANSKPYLNHFSSLKSSFLSDQLELCANDEAENFSYYIKKIKFKPGYMTFWREARSVFKEVLNLNFKYQKRLTNYILKFNKILKFNLYLNNEMSLRNVLQRCRFFFDWNTSDFFLSQGLFYVNGSPCFNYYFQLYVGDFIQMIVHLKYYILYRWLSHWITKKRQKIKIKTKKKLTISTSDEDKTRTNKYPKWILFNKNLCDDIAKFFEIDFFTLSVFVIYEPFTWRDLNLYSHFANRFSIINMYNWKYIT